MIARSTDGVHFTGATVFQDSGGVPSAIQWRGDTLVCVFQWCRAPVGGPNWDKVAVRLSFDRGATWTEPRLAVFNGLPPQYQRPFDPTVAVFAGDSIRIYFSSSNGMPPPGGDSVINTYSARSVDGVNYQFEPGPRVDHPTRRVIDPAVAFFNGVWHYVSPVGAPQEGAYHYVSPDGLSFTRVADIGSDPTHNWTGNFVVNDSADLRFYGSGPRIWFNSSPDGSVWTGYTNTTAQGGDPTVVKLGAGEYVAVYVGQPYAGVAGSDSKQVGRFALFPSPARSKLVVRCEWALRGSAFRLCNAAGMTVRSGVLEDETNVLRVNGLPDGAYVLVLAGRGSRAFRVVGSGAAR